MILCFYEHILLLLVRFLVFRAIILFFTEIKSAYFDIYDIKQGLESVLFMQRTMNIFNSEGHVWYHIL